MTLLSFVCFSCTKDITGVATAVTQVTRPVAAEAQRRLPKSPMDFVTTSLSTKFAAEVPTFPKLVSLKSSQQAEIEAALSWFWLG